MEDILTGSSKSTFGKRKKKLPTPVPPNRLPKPDPHNPQTCLTPLLSLPVQTQRVTTISSCSTLSLSNSGSDRVVAPAATLIVLRWDRKHQQKQRVYCNWKWAIFCFRIWGGVGHMVCTGRGKEERGEADRDGDWGSDMFLPNLNGQDCFGGR